MIAAAIILAVLILIAITPIGAVAEYSDKSITLSAVAGLIRIKLLPRPEKASGKPKKEKKPKKKKPKKKKKTEHKVGKEKQPAAKKPGTVKLLLKLLPVAGKALNRFRKKLTIDELTVWYLVASDDPYKTAMTFGYMNAGVDPVLMAIGKIFRIRKKNVRTSVSFETSEPLIYVKAKLTIRIWQILYIGFGLLFGALITYIKFKLQNDSQKGGKSNG